MLTPAILANGGVGDQVALVCDCFDGSIVELLTSEFPPFRLLINLLITFLTQELIEAITHSIVEDDRDLFVTRLLQTSEEASHKPPRSNEEHLQGRNVAEDARYCVSVGEDDFSWFWFFIEVDNRTEEYCQAIRRTTSKNFYALFHLRCISFASEHIPTTIKNPELFCHREDELRASGVCFLRE